MLLLGHHGRLVVVHSARWVGCARWAEAATFPDAASPRGEVCEALIVAATWLPQAPRRAVPTPSAPSA